MGKVFKTAIFGGFRKKEVIDYLDTLSRDKKLEKEINDERTVKLEQANFELKKAFADLQLEMDELAAKLEISSAEREPLRAKIDELEKQKSALSGELSRAKTLLRELEQHNSSLNSRVLDFDDERRSLEADCEDKLREKQERISELENRIFDLEAEIVESLEPKPAPQPAAPPPPPPARSVEKAYYEAQRAFHGAAEASRGIDDPQSENGRRVLEDLKFQLEQVICEINRLIQTREFRPPSAQSAPQNPPEPPAGKREKRLDSRLCSLNDILRHVTQGKHD